MATTTYTHTKGDNTLVDMINSGEITKVKGEEVWARFGHLQPLARMCKNGTICVMTRRNSWSFIQNHVWIKVGQTISVGL